MRPIVLKRIGMLEPFVALPPQWLREAEVSFARHAPHRVGFQTRLDDAGALHDFLATMGLEPSPFLAADQEVRARFMVSPSHWAKVGWRGGRAVEASQYFLLDPACHYPITTLRVFARRLGQGAHPQLEALLVAALEEREARWGLALKPSPGGRRAAAFCNLSRDALAATLEKLAATPLLAQLAPFGGRPRVFLTVDLLDPFQLAVDVEEPTTRDAWLATLCARMPRYLKCRPAGDGGGSPADAFHWTAYFPWASVAPPSTPQQRLDSIRAYYERTHRAYLDAVGPTFQAGLIAPTPSESNLALARRAGLEAGMRVLDAGCGVCGPALDIAGPLDLSMDCVSLSPSQVAEAARRIADSGMSSRVRVSLGDYHALAAADGQYDAVVMFESMSYTPEPQRLFAELWRVLRPGGRLYIKDFSVCERPLGDAELRALDDYDLTYSTQTRPLSSIVAALGEAGFAEIRSAPLATDMSHFHQAMVAPPVAAAVGSAFLSRGAPQPTLTPFGRDHRRSWESLPVEAFELWARRPPGAQTGPHTGCGV